jgi:hypothetical protein
MKSDMNSGTMRKMGVLKTAPVTAISIAVHKSNINRARRSFILRRMESKNFILSPLWVL